MSDNRGGIFAVLVALIIVVCLVLGRCSPSPDIKEPKGSIIFEEIKEEPRYDDTKYILVLSISEFYQSYEISEKLKDDKNSVTLELSVDKELYDNISIGSYLDSNIGSKLYLVRGSKYMIMVEDKYEAKEGINEKENYQSKEISEGVG